MPWQHQESTTPKYQESLLRRTTSNLHANQLMGYKFTIHLNLLKQVWRCGNVSFSFGVGVFRKYTKDWYHSAAATIKEFTLCEATTKVQKKKKERADRQLCKIVFCNGKGYIETFTDFRQRDNHMLTIITQHSKGNFMAWEGEKSFAARIISSTTAQRVLTSSPISESVKQNGDNYDDANSTIILSLESRSENVFI